MPSVRRPLRFATANHRLSTALVLVLVVSCSVFEASAPPRPGEHLTIGIKFDQPGVGHRTDEGTYEGIDVGIALRVAAGMGVPEHAVTFVEARSEERENLLAQQKVDLVVASYSITEPRKRYVDFAGPYFTAGQALLVRRKNTDVTGPQSLDSPDWRLCSVIGSAAAHRVKNRWARSVTLKEVESYRECVDALRNGDVDAVTTDDVVLAGYVAAEPEKFKLVGPPFSQERYGIGLHRGDPRRAAVTRALRVAVEDGSWRRIMRENLSKSNFPIPPVPQILDSP
ncbi:glutamate ABC transporter substrate-binding protein [Umezawaea beigongshangensis]|uniref:glutamate ABC transporter substrate-binding protein n=1 Tax=Umezawaea beigongshangensis TaxID=2780383 RepID=UPI0018F182A8|nr:glutamate ABC transporter substrate-binding protein [Umezawaea beigongshangensis]